jgi:hypothetical protein
MTVMSTLTLLLRVIVQYQNQVLSSGLHALVVQASCI